MSRKLQSHPLSKPSIEKKVERIFKKMNEEKKIEHHDKAHSSPKKR